MSENKASSSASADTPIATARRALDWVSDGQTLGLGTGRAATAFVRALGERVRDGLKVSGVPTSEVTAALARELSIPLLTLEEAGTIDVCFDGADEVDPNLDLIKGYGGAHVREKIVAASSSKLVILVGVEKVVEVLGSRGKLPVEVLPFGEAHCREALRRLGCEPKTRSNDDGTPLISDNGNYILDCKIAPIENAAELERAILDIPGVLGTGLFIGMADAVIIQDGDAVEVRER
ncbi:MAG: ribose-5-phosphate isomerase RpiA [Deltaproteobacteria bacterium]|nr:ribose-5-phosphate isomerase RpiA [Deltaproteobacteria bacterium]MBW2389268.1 ribose-5-phosphate isomerase RpiA [Deltaproteobacteria bacterium]MBW2722873.1 ribose-5-phosphate isomerase RpiA [Deltaproteobacteria bacterium]